jgi:hypothetical protein
MAGLERKYEVRRVADGAAVDDAFVLRIRKDPAAWMAAWNYATSTRNGELRRDMERWLRENVPTAESLGTEGQINRDLLTSIMQIQGRQP